MVLDVKNALNLAVEALRRGDISGSQAAIRTVIAERPGHPDCYNLSGLNLVALNDYVYALYEFMLAIRFKSDVPEYYCNAAMCNIRLGRMDDAKDVLQKGLSAAGENALCRDMLARLGQE